MPLGKPRCGAVGVSGCEPQYEVQCEPQNEVQCEVLKTALESRFLLLTFCPTTQWGGAAQTARPRLTRWKLMSVSQDTSARAADPGCGDKRRLRKTKTPGVFKRVDGAGQTIGYVSVFRSAGRQRKRHARTYDEAKRIKRESETDRDRGEFQERTTMASSATSMNGSSATAARAVAASARARARNTAA
jgi:hypothetical protein